jgi:DNA-binding response OmpR family regulator
MNADSHGPHVLIVDDDPTTRDTMSLVLRVAGFQVHEAADAPAAMAAAHTHRFDLSLLDQRLDGVTGLQLAKRFRDDGISVPWILYSGFMDYELACEAGRLGAVRAIGMPFDVEAVVMEALEHVRRCTEARWPARPVSGRLQQPGTTVGRAAYWILRGCDANEDPSTIPTWGLVARATESQLRDAFKRLHIPRSDARDFMRILRALWCAVGRVEYVEGELTPGRSADDRCPVDPRGSPLAGHRPVTFEYFLAHQEFIPTEHPLLQSLRTLHAQL